MHHRKLPQPQHSQALYSALLSDLQSPNLCDGFDGGTPGLVPKQGILSEVVSLHQRGHLVAEAWRFH